MRNKLKRPGEGTTEPHNHRSSTKPKTAARPTAETRDMILAKLRHALAFQIGLWDTASEIAEMAGTDLDWVLKWVNAIAIVADLGLELGPDDLEDFLGDGEDSYKVGGKLTEYLVQ
jgi:hypothetical protein